MSAERDLAALLRGMRPRRHPGRYVFTSVTGDPPVAGYHHDHLFVPHDRADRALSVLDRLAGPA